MSNQVSPTHAQEGHFNYATPGAPEARPDGKKGDLNGPQRRAQEALQQRAAVEDRPAQQADFGTDTIRAWWGHASKSLEQFVLDNPVIALVTMVVFGMFGISQILPTFLAAILTGIPLCLYSFMVGQTIWQDHDRFTKSLERVVLGDIIAQQANGAVAAH